MKPTYHRTAEQQSNEQIRKQSDGIDEDANDDRHPRDINQSKLTTILNHTAADNCLQVSIIPPVSNKLGNVPNRHITKLTSYHPGGGETICTPPMAVQLVRGRVCSPHLSGVGQLQAAGMLIA